MFHFATLSLGLIVALRFLPGIPMRWSIRSPLCALILLVSLHHLIARLVFGTMFSPEVPRAVMIAVNWIFVATLLLALAQIVLDAATLLVSALARSWKRPPLILRATMGALALLLSAYGVSQALRVPDARTIEVAIPDLPEAFDGYRILQLTDLHLSRLFQRPWTEAMVEVANRQGADLIAITGDLIDGTLEARLDDVEPLSRLSAPDGVYVSPGNHEYYFGQPAWMARFAELGMNPLVNEHRVVERDGAQLVLAGVADRAASNVGLTGPDIAASLDGAPENAPVVLLDHQPRGARRNAAAGVALQLSGHTHGGMILGFDRFIASFNEGFVSGAYDVDGMTLYVGNGTALWIGFAVRLGVPPEMTTIVLRRS